MDVPYAVNGVMHIGIIPNRKSADAQIYTLLNRDNTFNKIAPGVYQLTDAFLDDAAPEGALKACMLPDDIDDLPF